MAADDEMRPGTLRRTLAELVSEHGATVTYSMLCQVIGLERVPAMQRHVEQQSIGSDRMVIVVQLPQQLHVMSSLLRTLGDLWPSATFKHESGFQLLEIEPDV